VIGAPSGMAQRALMTPHFLSPSAVFLHRPSALAASNASVLVSVSPVSQGLSSSFAPEQSSSLPLPGTSNAPGLMFLSQSLQSPSFEERPSPSWSVPSWWGHVGSPRELPLDELLVPELAPELELELLSPELVPLEPELDALPLLVPELPEEAPPSAPPTNSPDPAAPLHAARTS